jgi:hypothetical protein
MDYALSARLPPLTLQTKGDMEADLAYGLIW